MSDSEEPQKNGSIQQELTKNSSLITSEFSHLYLTLDSC